jgi:hypothetical protein
MTALIWAGHVSAQAPTPAPAPAGPSQPERCALTAADMKANARLSFERFDQDGDTPTNARALGERGCFAEAARAAEHYLVFGPELTERERNVVTWHLGQYLASAGAERAAANIMASTRRPSAPEPDGFDWNTYVTGTWAFLVKDRALLQQATDRLAAGSGQRNAMNAAVLKRLSRCFERPYVEAYDNPACNP